MYGEAGLLRRKAGPFDRSCSGQSLAFSEGAVTLVLEERSQALARGAPIIARISGHGHCNEGMNPFTVDSTGRSQARLISSVLCSAGIEAREVDFVVGHGNGLPDCALAERNYMRELFGDRASETPFISTKPVFGHALGAAGVVNVAASALMLHNGRILQSVVMNTTDATRSDGDRGPDLADRGVNHGVSFTCGMGGVIAACLLEREVSQR